MASPFPYASTIGNTLGMLDPAARAKPSEGEQVQSLILQRTVASDTLGGWAGDKYAQTNHNTGMVAISGKAYTDAVIAAKFRVLEKKPSTIKKSSGVGHYSQDEEYGPADPDHPLCKILEEPGGPDGAWTFADECEFLALQFLLTGDAPAWCPVNDKGKPVQFYSLTSALVTTHITAGQNPMYPKGAYRVTPYSGGTGFYAGGTLLSQAILPGEEVKRLRERHPWSRNMGMSRLQSGAKEADVLEAIMKSRWNYFNEGPQLDCVISMPGTDIDTVRKLQGDIKARHGGADNHGNRILILGGGFPDGKPAVQTIGQTSQEMTFLESFDQAAGVVLAFYRVPKSAAGLTAASNYSGLYAEKQQLREYGLIPFFLRLSNFLTGALAKPWCEFPGQYRIEAEPPPLGDLEMEEKQFEHDVQTGIVTYNQALRKRNLPPVGPEGDVPFPLYQQKLQQAMQPQLPQQLPPDATDGMPGAEQPADGEQSPAGAMPGEQSRNHGQFAAKGGAEQPAAPEQDEQGTQDAVTQAALEALGVPGEEPQQPVAKAVGSPGGGWHPSMRNRQEGAKWELRGRWFTKENGKIKQIADPSKQKQPAAQQSTGKPPATSSPITVTKPGRKPPAPAQQPSGAVPTVQPTGANPQKNYDALAARFLKNGPVKLLVPGQNGGYAQHEVKDGASLKAFFDKGGLLPESAFAEPAAKVQATTPVAQKVVQSVSQWAASHADRHADRVAAHFGVSRERAHAILVHAITAVAGHAAKTGGQGASGVMNVGGKKLRVTVPGKQGQQQKGPTSGAVPRPANPAAKGSRPPMAKAMDAANGLEDSAGGYLTAAQVKRRKRRKEAKRALAVIERVKKAQEQGAGS